MTHVLKQESKAPPQPAPRARERIEAAAASVGEEEKKVRTSLKGSCKPFQVTRINGISFFKTSSSG